MRWSEKLEEVGEYSDDEEVVELTPETGDTGGEGAINRGRPGPPPHPGSVWKEDWGKAYLNCSAWREPYSATQDPQESWPGGFQFKSDMLLRGGRVCVPTPLQERVIYDHHGFLGHVGFQRLWDHMSIRYEWGNVAWAMKFAKEVMGGCEACQACQKPHTLRTKIECTPIPPAVMVSVSMDLFKLPPVGWEGVTYDSLIVCVDRHSGWVVAVPEVGKGLTGEKVARAMVRHQWRPFGVPSVITSDQGSQFIGSWWQNMCALLGIRHAMSHAYHHRANGRAERGGQQLFERLRRLQIEGEFSWVEALPQVLDRLHDTPG